MYMCMQFCITIFQIIKSIKTSYGKSENIKKNYNKIYKFFSL